MQLSVQLSAESHRHLVHTQGQEVEGEEEEQVGERTRPFVLQHIVKLNTLNTDLLPWLG